MALTSVAKETRLANEFRSFISAAGPLRHLREEAFGYFRENGFPTPGLEDWKYTNIAPIEREDWRISDTGLRPPDLEDDFMRLLREFRSDRNGLAALNLGFGEITCIRIPKDTSVAEPIELKVDGGNEGSASFPHYLVIAEAGSKATLIETYASQTRSWTNAAIQILVEDNANLTHYC